MAINFRKWFASFLGGTKPTPAPVPPTPATPAPILSEVRAVAVIVTGAIGPLAGATVVLDNPLGITFPKTNADGYTVAEFPVSLITATLWVSAPNYRPYNVGVTLPTHNIDLMVGGTARPEQMQLPALFPIAKPRPTREQVLNMKCSFANMSDSKGRRMFTAMIGRFWLDNNMADFNDWVNASLTEGCTHLVVAFQSNDYGSYFVKGFDFTGHEDRWTAMLQYLLDQGLIPVVFYTSGDNFGELAHLEHRCTVSVDFKDVVGHCIGFEMIGSQSPTITSKQWYDANQTMRRIFGENAVIIMHSDPAERCTWASYRGDNPNDKPEGCVWDVDHWVEADDPSHGDEVGAMSHIFTPDLLCIETRHDKGPSYTMGDLNDTTTWSGHMVEIQDRFGADGTMIPGLNRAVRTGPSAPDWFRGAAKRTRLVIFETVCYEYIGNKIGEDQAIAASRRCREIVPYEGGYRKG